MTSLSTGRNIPPSCCCFSLSRCEVPDHRTCCSHPPVLLPFLNSMAHPLEANEMVFFPCTQPKVGCFSGVFSFFFFFFWIYLAKSLQSSLNLPWGNHCLNQCSFLSSLRGKYLMSLFLPPPVISHHFTERNKQEVTRKYLSEAFNDRMFVKWSLCRF